MFLAVVGFDDTIFLGGTTGADRLILLDDNSNSNLYKDTGSYQVITRMNVKLNIIEFSNYYASF